MNSPLRDAVDGATICAISTAPGAGGIAVIRVSGDHALELGSKVFSKPLADVTDRSVAFGKFKNAAGDTLDQSHIPASGQSSSEATQLSRRSHTTGGPTRQRWGGKIGGDSPVAGVCQPAPAAATPRRGDQRATEPPYDTDAAIPQGVLAPP